METRICFQEWILLCQELYRATSRWVAEHPDTAPADIEQIITTSCPYLHARLTDDLTRHHDPAQRLPESEAAIGVLIRFAPAVWRCQDTDDLVTIRGIAGYRHDGQVRYLKAAQSQTGIPLHDLVRYVADPTKPAAPLVVAQQSGVSHQRIPPCPYGTRNQSARRNTPHVQHCSCPPRQRCESHARRSTRRPSP